MAIFGLGLGGGWSCRGRSRGSRGCGAAIAARGLAAGRLMAANTAAADFAAGLAAPHLGAANLLHLAARLAAARLASGGAGGRGCLGRLTRGRGAGGRLAAPHLGAANLLYLAARLTATRCRRTRGRSTHGRLATRRGAGPMEQARLGRGAKQQNQGTGSHQRENNTTVHGHTPLWKNGRLPTLGSWIGFPHHQSTTAIGGPRPVLLASPPRLVTFRTFSGRLYRMCVARRSCRISRRCSPYRDHPSHLFAPWRLRMT